MTTIISDMSQPLGNTIGNTLEIIESVETLKNNGPKDLTDLCLELAGGMVYLAGLTKNHKEGVKKAKEALESGKALESFRDLIKRQGGDAKIVDDYSRLPQAKKVTKVVAPKAGYVHFQDNELIGLLCVELGGGRKKATDKIDFGVGFTLNKKEGEKIKKGETLLTIHHNANQTKVVSDVKKRMLSEAIAITGKKPQLPPFIYETKTSWSKK